MSDMKIVLSLTNYTIYQNNNYYICLPNKYCTFYHLFMGFSFKDLNKLSEEELIKEIRLIGDSVNVAYPNGIYVLPIINPDLLIEATNENDDRLYNKILNKKIQPITHEVYSLFSNRNTQVSPVIKMIKQNNMDTKLIGWIYLKLGSVFVKEILFDNTPPEVEVQKEVENTIHEEETIFLDSNEYLTSNDEVYIKDSLKAAVSPGFGSIGSILFILSISIVLGSIIMYMILK